MIAYLFNIADLLFTLYALSIGCTELNPLMKNIPLQIFFKVFIVGVLCWWLSKRKEPLAQYGLRICTAVYAVLCAYHVVGLFILKG